MLAALASRDLAAVHRHAGAAAADPRLARLARLATGAALLLDGAYAEALRDLDGAGPRGAGAAAARRLRARAQERLDLFDEAERTYDALLADDPADAAAFAGRAALRARGDRAARDAAVADLERFAAAHPDAVPVWRAIGELSRGGDGPALARGVAAFSRVTALRPDDPAAWDALGGALALRARAAGGEAPWLEAAAAYARATEVAPASGTAWFNRAASLHEAALALPLGGDPATFAARWGEAREAYGRALATGPSGEAAGRVLFNLGLLLEVAPPGAVPAPGLPATPRIAFEAAAAQEPDRPGVRAALLGALVAEGDAAAAREGLARLPAHVDPGERTVLEAAVRWIGGDADGTRAALARPGPPPRGDVDPLPPLARALLERDYRRTALALLLPEARDPARVHLRARARAELRDRPGLDADLALLDRLDPRLAADVRARDVSIRRALGL
jgi:tetratricopeptide (TPR) repeat protein